jgi:hypothetical protein
MHKIKATRSVCFYDGAFLCVSKHRDTIMLIKWYDATILHIYNYFAWS